MSAEVLDDNCINFVKMKFINNTLYFEAENDENLESDYFRKLESRVSVIRDVDNQVLFFDNRCQAVFEDMTDYECEENEDQTKFIMCVYKDSFTRGMATAISVKYKKMFTLFCTERGKATFKEMNPPQDISDEQSAMIFFQRAVPGHHDKVQFESSLYKGCFLACQKENDLFRLMLKEGGNSADKSLMFSVKIKSKTALTL
ncbi:PREDICTED: interleukin-18 [Condylura cristata]|uniref:interleukin-18 n=1 Tax=Condylura cristata TaxID=143302 RepID=UPI0006439FE4|nr:PREDICTED: interleukin-18 [Condylura cristata]